MKSDKELMIAGELYDPSDTELVNERLKLDASYVYIIKQLKLRLLTLKITKAIIGSVKGR